MPVIYCPDSCLTWLENVRHPSDGFVQEAQEKMSALGSYCSHVIISPWVTSQGWSSHHSPDSAGYQVSDSSGQAEVIISSP